MQKILNRFISQLLQTYYRGPDHPAKLRIYHAFRRMQGYAWLTVPYANGGWIIVDERDLVPREIFAKGCYEPEVWEALVAFADSNEIVWDVGAHIGSFAIRAGLDGRVKEVHAFEPDLFHLEILKRNLSLNKGRYLVYLFALSDQRETRRLFHGPLANTGLSSFTLQSNEAAFQVDCKVIDEMIYKEKVVPPTLMKIDVEGWEIQVLKGAQRLLETLPPKAIVFETEAGNSLEFLAHYLEGFGYQVKHLIRPSGVKEERENFLASR